MNSNYKNYRKYTLRWGFYLENEILNGRGAMILLMLILILEIFTQKTLFIL